MDLQQFIQEQKRLYKILLMFIEESDDGSELINLFESMHIYDDKILFKELLQLISIISNNHFRSQNFINKITQIIHNIQDKIKQTFSNHEIFNFFHENKLILLFLFENRIIEPDDQINEKIIFSYNRSYKYYFYPEIKEHLNESSSFEKELKEKDENIFESYDEKRQIGENDSYICSLIRNDSVKEFIMHINKVNYPLDSQIPMSFFETNELLLKNKENIQLIEYAAFFGSIEIIKYLHLNNVVLKPNLWIYAIHSQNAELIYFLEDKKVDPPNNSYNECIKEAIKCHHNDIARYLIENKNIENKDIISYSCQYKNYHFFPDEIKKNDKLFYYACLYNHVKLVDCFIKNKSIDINATIIFFLNF